MDLITLTLSDETLAALRPPAPKARVGESILRLLQMLSIVGAAFWTLYVYTTFQEQSNDFALRAAALQEIQSRLTIKLTRLDAEKREIELERARQSPVMLSHDVNAVRLSSAGGGRFRYFVTYNYTIENVSDRPLEVDRVIVRGFYARKDDFAAESQEINDFGQPKPVQWSRVFKRAHLLKDWKEGCTLPDSGEQITALRGGGGTGPINSKEVQRGGVDLIIVAKPEDLIGFKVRLRIDDGDDLPDKRYMSTIRTIKSTEGLRSASNT